MNLSLLPFLWQQFCACLASFFDRRHAWRLPRLFFGILFAQHLRTVASWLRAAAVGKDFYAYYLLLSRFGRKARIAAGDLLHRTVSQTTPPDGPLLVAIDDSPTQRYGPFVQGAGIHHNPTPGPAGQHFLYGHVWVTLAVLAEHKDWGTLGLPLRTDLYVRQADLASIPSHHLWPFRTKLQLAADQLAWLAEQEATLAGRRIIAATDGAYAKRPVLKAARQNNVTVVSRLPRNAALWDVPRRPRGQRPVGRPRTYGTKRISLRHRAAHPLGWQEVRVEQYGEECQRTWKTEG